MPDPKPYVSGFCNPTLPRTAAYDPHARCRSDDCTCQAADCHNVRACGCPRLEDHRAGCPEAVTPEEVCDAIDQQLAAAELRERHGLDPAPHGNPTTMSLGEALAIQQVEVPVLGQFEVPTVDGGPISVDGVPITWSFTPTPPSQERALYVGGRQAGKTAYATVAQTVTDRWLEAKADPARAGEADTLRWVMDLLMYGPTPRNAPPDGPEGATLAP